MADEPQPEVILPSRRPRQAHRHGAGPANEQLDLLARVLDDIFQVPGTNIRFGLDSLIGLLPGFGDAISGLLSTLIVWTAWQRGLPRATVYRMVGNIALDSLLGAVPILGDLFDVAWKSNRKNYQLLVRSEARSGRQDWRDWLFLGLMLACLAALVAAPFAVLYLVVHYWRQ